MYPFAYARPTTLPEALQLLDAHRDAALLAGGTDLVVELRNRSRKPGLVIDLKRVKELAPAIRESGDRLTISATTAMAAIEEDGTIRRRFPALVEAAATVGSIQIRNRATLVGNVCHASPAADTVPALLVYGAQITIAGLRGTRRLPLNDFLVARGQTDLQSGELVISIDLPLDALHHAAAFVRVTRRRGVDLATINLCCMVDAAGRTRLAYGALGPRAFLAEDESGVLASPTADAAAKDKVLAELLSHARPITDVRGSLEYRRAMLLVMSRRALRTAIERLHEGAA